LLDAQRALSLVRFHSRAWGIVPDHIGIVGFSAGGHLAIRSATAFDHRGYKRIDAIDDVSCRPDFAIAVYPGYLIPQQPEGPTLDLAPDLVIPPRMPPVFLVHASDDTVSSARHSAAMYLALKQAQVPAELHLYAQGGHGFGVRPGPLPCTRWTDRCESWLQSLKFLPRPTPDHSPIAPRPGRP
jgi:acetyl esterase/lipase